jgi:hypothetical protein
MSAMSDSDSGANADIIEALETAKRREAPTMILTSVPNCPSETHGFEVRGDWALGFWRRDY